MTRSTVLGLATLVALGCGGGEERTLPDESGDLRVGSGGSRTSHLAGTTPVGPELANTRWSFVEGSCTEGPLPVDASTMQRTVELVPGERNFLLVYDHRIGDCVETIGHRATPGDSADSEWQMHEEARVTVGECSTRAEADRPGDLRLRGQFLEVYVQRSVWCNGYEVKMVYARTNEPPSEEELVRRYALHFNRRDARKVTELFADNGSLVEPFNRTPENHASRHDGRASVYAWYQETFANTPWLALNVTGIESGATPGSYVMSWQYMDPRLDLPFGGRNRFTIAGGEIFETSIEITETQIEVEGLEGASEETENAAPQAMDTSDADPATPAAEGAETAPSGDEPAPSDDEPPPPPADPEAGDS